MKRMHVHVSVENIDSAIGFYSALFTAEPAVVKPATAEKAAASSCCNT